MAASDAFGRRLASCHGFLVLARDGPVGTVETPVFYGVARDPDFLIIRVAEMMPGTFRIVAAALVEGVDPEQPAITLALTSREVGALPEGLPLASRRRIDDRPRRASDN
jgi:hypothetical protein